MADGIYGAAADSPDAVSGRLAVRFPVVFLPFRCRHQPITAYDSALKVSNSCALFVSAALLKSGNVMGSLGRRTILSQKLNELSNKKSRPVVRFSKADKSVRAKADRFMGRGFASGVRGVLRF